MAGTGHSYEISNIGEVTKHLAELTSTANEHKLDVAARWISTSHFRKYVTGRDFSRPYDPTKDARPDEPHLLRKLMQLVTDGKTVEIRTFHAGMLRSVGPDFTHIFDYLVHLRDNDPRQYAKTPRMPVPEIHRKAERWLVDLVSPKGGSAGRTETVLELNDGFHWVEMLDADALENEGEVMSHCISSYSNRLDTARLFSLRGRDQKRYLSLQLNRTSDASGERLVLVQVSARANGNVPFALHDPLVAILSHFDVLPNEAVARRHMIRKQTNGWASEIKSWRAEVINGRAAFTDGRSVVILSDRSSAPLITVSHVSGGGDWFRQAFDHRYLSISDAAADQPHYDEQKTACDFLNSLPGMDTYRSRPYTAPSWLGLIETNGGASFIPSVDRFEKRLVDDVAYYATSALKRDGSRFDSIKIPHSDDPARILLETVEPEGGYKWAAPAAKVVEARTVSKHQAERILTVLTQEKVSTLAGDDKTRQFKSAFEPMFIDGAWRAFALDRLVEPAVHCEGEWGRTDYFLRLTAKGQSKWGLRTEWMSMVLRDGTVMHGSGDTSDEGVAREITRKLNELKLKGNGLLNFGSYGKAPTIMLLPGERKWRHATSATGFWKMISPAVHSAVDNPRKADGALLDIVVGTMKRLEREGKGGRHIVERRTLALKAWMLAEKDFDKHFGYRSEMKLVSERDRQYTLEDRLCDLYDGGFRPETPKEMTQFRKLLRAFSKKLGRKPGHFAETSLMEVLMRWAIHADKSLLNKCRVFFPRPKSFTEKYDLCDALTAHIQNKELWHTGFMTSMCRAVEELVGETDHSGRKAADVLRHLRLAALVSRSFIYGKFEDGCKVLTAKAREHLAAGDYSAEEAEEAGKHLARFDAIWERANRSGAA